MMLRAAWVGVLGVVALSASSSGCRRASPTTVVVVGPPALEARLREAAASLGKGGRKVEVRIARLDERSLEGADVAVAQSAAGLQPIAEALTGTRVTFDCADEVVLVGLAGPEGARAQPLTQAVTDAESVILADPRGAGAGEAGEAALSRAGLRAKVASKLRYVPLAADVLRAIGPGTVGLVMRSDLVRSEDVPAGVVVLASGFDGARDCPTAALLAKAPHPDLARDLLAYLPRPSAVPPPHP